MNLTYVLVIDGASETALRTFRSRIGERSKVRVRNASEPLDVKFVNAWWSNEDCGLSFNYMDGDSDEVVQFGSEMADILLKNKT